MESPERERADTVNENETQPSNRAKAHLTPDERAAKGKSARALVPRSSQAILDLPGDRPDPIDLLESQAATRVPELVPLRYGRMLASSFTFFRGAALIMAADLATTPDSGLSVQACGDAHLSNFGAFASPERALVFDINDFDETAPGPWEWDLKRLVASLEIAGRSNGHTEAECRQAALAGANAYRRTMNNFARMRTLDVWYARLDLTTQMAIIKESLSAKRARRADKNLKKAQTRDSLQALARFTEIVDGRPRIVSDPPVIVRIEDVVRAYDQAPEDVEEEVRKIIRGYRHTLPSDRQGLLEQFDYMDAARKVVGVGSVGTRAWMVLLMGRDAGDPLFLQVKEAQESVLEPYTRRSRYHNAGHRVVAGQRLMQSASDIFLGWHRFEGIDGVERDYYVRQLRDWKGSAEVDRFEPEALAVYAQMCAWALAKAHARTGDRIAIASYLGKSDRLDRALADFASAYADQNEKDYQALRDAVASGRITALTGI